MKAVVTVATAGTQAQSQLAVELRRTIPRLRLAGFGVLTAMVALHKMAIDPGEPWSVVVRFAAGSLAYWAVTWALLQQTTSRERLTLVANRVAEGDIGVMAFAMACTGGGDSWLFPVMVLRAADHIPFGFRRVLWLGHLSSAVFLILLLSNVGWSLSSLSALGVAKLSAVYVFTLYLSWTAGAVDRLHERLRRARRALLVAKEAAEEASRSKSAFLATMSHELRTPLHSIIGHSELLQEECETDAPHLIPDLKRIDDAGHHLLGLVNDVLDLSKVEAGRIDVLPSWADVADIARDVVALTQTLATARANVLQMDAEGETSAYVDRRRTKQVILNLVGNACKFTENGRIHVSVRSLDGVVMVEVTDTGIGIAHDELERIFEEFVQVDTSPTRRYGGTGLGLALARRMCQQMGGTLSVASQLGRGSTFTLSLPARGPHGEARPERAETALAGVSVGG